MKNALFMQKCPIKIDLQTKEINIVNKIIQLKIEN